MTLVRIGSYEATKRSLMVMEMLQKTRNYSLKKNNN
jgi:hypothetical protein